MQLLHSFELLPSILLPSAQAKELAKGEVKPMGEAVAGVASLDMLLSPRPELATLPTLDPLFTTVIASDKSLKARVTLAAAFTPFRGLTYQVKKKHVKMVESVLRDGLKVGMTFCDVVHNN
jgi:tRNA nucleotidyltransferase (CCA-adding enzyme)